MAYMIYQQLTTAIKRSYAGDPEVARHREAARRSREWLEELRIDPALRDVLVEQHRALERAFDILVRRAS